MKALRYIIFIPVIIILNTAIYGGLFGLADLMRWTMSLNLDDLLWVKIVVGILFGLFCLQNLLRNQIPIFCYFLFFAFLKWLLGLGFYDILIFLIIFGWGWALLKWLTTVFSALVAKISPNKNFGFWAILVVGVLQAILEIYNIWTKGLELNEDKALTITLLMLVSIGVLTLTYRLIIGAAAARE
jgi:hypothetical protein